MRTSAAAHDSERRLGTWLAFGFGCVFVAVILALAFGGNTLDDRRFEILRIVLALAGGGIGGVIPGFLDLNMKAGTKWALRAGGGLAVFIVLYFWSPAHWVAVPPGSLSINAAEVKQSPNGPCSPAIIGNQNTLNCSGAIQAPLQPADFRLRFCVDSFAITPADLQRAPKLLHIRGRLAGSELRFDLRQVDTIVYASSRGGSMPQICYESEHFEIPGLAIMNKRGISGESFIFGVPFELRNFMGPDTKFDANLYIRDQWRPTGMSRFDDGTVKIEIPLPRPS
jgi:hypothetical protein